MRCRKGILKMRAQLAGSVSVWRRVVVLPLCVCLLAAGSAQAAGGLPLAIRGDLFAEPGPHPAARWISETVLVTQLEVKRGRWVIGNIGFTRHGQEHLTKLARDIIADNERLYASQQLDESDP